MAKQTADPIVRIITGASVEARDLRRRIKEACALAGDPLTTQAIFAWKELKSGVPPRRVEVVAKVLRMRKSQIRPDIFPPARFRSSASLSA
jgi:hypothetical protein